MHVERTALDFDVIGHVDGHRALVGGDAVAAASPSQEGGIQSFLLHHRPDLVPTVAHRDDGVQPGRLPDRPRLRVRRRVASRGEGATLTRLPMM